jgi:hypothetical protein
MDNITFWKTMLHTFETEIAWLESEDCPLDAELRAEQLDDLQAEVRIIKAKHLGCR